MDAAYHLSGDDAADYEAAIAYTRLFAWYQLIDIPTFDVDALSLNVPADASPETPWRLTRLSRQRYYVPCAPDRANGRGRPGYRPLQNVGQVELDSDIWAIKVDRVVSVTPLSLDLTARVDFSAADSYLQAKLASCQGVLDSLAGLEPRFPSVSPLPVPPAFAREIETLAAP
jgi:5'-nucleotidase